MFGVIAIKYVEAMVEEVEELVSKKINHPFFIMHIDDVEINKAELSMLIVLLQEIGLDHKQILHYATTIMLIQIALDTHEKVSDYVDTPRVNKQLTVLAGDYFSGWYYYLLATNRDIHLIGVLAEGIRTINEKKIKLYRKDFHNFDEIMCLVEQIEMGLINSASNYFQKEIDLTIISKMFLLKRLKDESKMIQLTGTSPILEWVKDDNMIQKLTVYLEKLKKQIQAQIFQYEKLAFIYQTYI